MIIKKLITFCITCPIKPASSSASRQFNNILTQLKPGDVILTKGRSRVSRVIGYLTKSEWTHAALYLGKLSDLDLSTIKSSEIGSSLDDQEMVIESLLKTGVTLSSLYRYRHDEMCIYRAKEIDNQNVHTAIEYAIKKLNTPYDVRQILDLARFLLPWRLIPRCWHSSLFNQEKSNAVKLTCATMISEVFQKINIDVKTDEPQNNR